MLAYALGQDATSPNNEQKKIQKEGRKQRDHNNEEKQGRGGGNSGVYKRALTSCYSDPIEKRVKWKKQTRNKGFVEQQTGMSRSKSVKKKKRI